MAATVASFRWLDILEKEFDKAFVDVNSIVGEIDDDSDDVEPIEKLTPKLNTLSSCFAQLAHKAQTIFQTNAKLEAELLNLKHELIEAEASKKILADETNEMLFRLHASQLKLKENDQQDQDNADSIRATLEQTLNEERERRFSVEVPKQEIVQLKKENELLKKHNLDLQAELAGAKMTSKYLDKELAGRIQQLQLLSQEWNGDEHETLWKQLNAEIQLHRHKTVVRACRLPHALSHSIIKPEDEDQSKILPRPQKCDEPRFVNVFRDPKKGLGISITGGREHGVPTLISAVHEDLLGDAAKLLFVGDTILSANGISLSGVSHKEAVDLLSSLEGEIVLEVVFVNLEEDATPTSILDEALSFKFRMFDDEVSSVTGVGENIPQGRLSRASIDSVRGSTIDNDEIEKSPDVQETDSEKFDDSAVQSVTSETAAAPDISPDEGKKGSLASYSEEENVTKNAGKDVENEIAEDRSTASNNLVTGEFVQEMPFEYSPLLDKKDMKAVSLKDGPIYGAGSDIFNGSY